MSSIINFLGKQVPSSPQQACSNFRRNLGNLYNGARLVASFVLGVSGLVIASGCYSESCGDRVLSTLTTPSSISERPQCALDASRTACLFAGVLYGAGSLVYLGVVLGNQVIVPFNKRKRCYPYTTVRQELLCNVPVVVAGSLGMVYGLMCMPMCMLMGRENHGPVETIWCKVGHSLGVMSGGLYLADVGVMYFDMCFTNLGVVGNMGNKEVLSVIMLSSSENAVQEVEEDITQQELVYSSEPIKEVLEGSEKYCKGKNGRKGFFCCVKRKNYPENDLENAVMCPPLGKAGPEVVEDVIQ
ncbi:hypothetical protein [Candidatus Clavichlamydia salmonicola]|uniref:hypothetical protein n=1 Tax=Candidatus Clavichlamydia salmonicola TaxID=469812 RepID=UPI0018912F4B|nr:hypothetical protein [Candidatus Clavichlamydia salmonicola]